MALLNAAAEGTAVLFLHFSAHPATAAPEQESFDPTPRAGRPIRYRLIAQGCSVCHLAAVWADSDCFWLDPFAARVLPEATLPAVSAGRCVRQIAASAPAPITACVYSPR